MFDLVSCRVCVGLCRGMREPMLDIQVHVCNKSNMSQPNFLLLCHWGGGVRICRPIPTFRPNRVRGLVHFLSLELNRLVLPQREFRNGTDACANNGSRPKLLGKFPHKLRRTWQISVDVAVSLLYQLQPHWQFSCTFVTFLGGTSVLCFVREKAGIAVAWGLLSFFDRFWSLLFLQSLVNILN